MVEVPGEGMVLAPTATADNDSLAKLRHMVRKRCNDDAIARFWEAKASVATLLGRAVAERAVLTETPGDVMLDSGVTVRVVQQPIVLSLVSTCASCDADVLHGRIHNAQEMLWALASLGDGPIDCHTCDAAKRRQPPRRERRKRSR